LVFSRKSKNTVPCGYNFGVTPILLNWLSIDITTAKVLSSYLEVVPLLQREAIQFFSYLSTFSNELAFIVMVIHE